MFFKALEGAEARCLMKFQEMSSIMIEELLCQVYKNYSNGSARK
jgi:hypothetical protein